jgi:hypothetical protein
MRGMSPPRCVDGWRGFSDEVRTSPGLCLVSAGVELAAGDGSSGLRWVRLLASAARRTASMGDDSPLTHWGEIVRASPRPDPRRRCSSAPNVARSSIGIGAWHVYGSFTVGGLRAMTGAADAVDVLLDGAHEAEVVGAHVHQANCLSLAAILLDLDGDRDAASARHVDATGSFVIWPGSRPTVAISTAAVHALHCARAGRRSEAIACLERSRVCCPGTRRSPPGTTC